MCSEERACAARKERVQRGLTAHFSGACAARFEPKKSVCSEVWSKS